MNPSTLADFLSSAGLIGIIALVFVETGVLVGFIFPADMILFTAGIFSAQPEPFAHLWQLLLFLPIAAALGDQLGYLTGRRFGPKIMRGPIIRWIGESSVERTFDFFRRYGAAAVVLARFVGIVRTLVPVVAGFSRMNHLKFTVFSILGSVLWSHGIVLLGYFLGGVALLRDNIELVFFASGILVLIPMVITVVARSRTRTRSREPSTTAG